MRALTWTYVYKTVCEDATHNTWVGTMSRVCVCVEGVCTWDRGGARACVRRRIRKNKKINEKINWGPVQWDQRAGIRCDCSAANVKRAIARAPTTDYVPVKINTTHADATTARIRHDTALSALAVNDKQRACENPGKIRAAGVKSRTRFHRRGTGIDYWHATVNERATRRLNARVSLPTRTNDAPLRFPEGTDRRLLVSVLYTLRFLYI